MIRAYQVKRDAKPGPWLAGMTLDPAAVSEAWCHQRGYICFIEELHRRDVKAGESFGAAYIVGWFDEVKEMERRLRFLQGEVEDRGGEGFVQAGVDCLTLRGAFAVAARGAGSTARVRTR